MSDLISRSAVLALGNVRRVTEYDEAGYAMKYNAVPVDVIENLPAVDAVPVVRCKDCLYGTPTYGDNYIRCAIWGEDIKNDKYCYCGKRRTVKQNG